MVSLQSSQGDHYWVVSDTQSLNDVLSRAKRLREAWDELEPLGGFGTRADGTVERELVPFEANELFEHVKAQVLHRQEVEQCLVELYFGLADGVMRIIDHAGAPGADGRRPRFMEMYLFSIGQQSDPFSPRRTYRFERILDKTLEFSSRITRRRGRGERPYRQALRALSAATVARQVRKRDARMTWLTAVLVA